MKYFFILLFLLFYLFKESTVGVVNSCGNDKYKISNEMPEKVEDCKDVDEPHCKFVNITKDGGENKRFCAIIHGKYNDKEVLDEVERLIKAKISVSESSRFGIKYFIFFFLLFSYFN